MIIKYRFRSEAIAFDVIKWGLSKSLVSGAWICLAEVYVHLCGGPSSWSPAPRKSVAVISAMSSESSLPQVDSTQLISIKVTVNTMQLTTSLCLRHTSVTQPAASEMGTNHKQLIALPSPLSRKVLTFSRKQKCKQPVPMLRPCCHATKAAVGFVSESEDAGNLLAFKQ